jgi:hypothetical protein
MLFGCLYFFSFFFLSCCNFSFSTFPYLIIKENQIKSNPLLRLLGKLIKEMMGI